MADNSDHIRNTSDQPAGLPMEALIGGPLEAAARSNMMLARSTAEFINSVGFDEHNQARVVDFKFDRMRQEENGELVAEEVDIQLPLIAVVPVPNLQIETVDLTFDVEVKSHFAENNTVSSDGTGEARVLDGHDRFKIYGVTTAHKEQTRSSDTTAKYHVEVHAANRQVPEALARVLDMMAAAVAPVPARLGPEDANPQSGVTAEVATAKKTVAKKTVAKKRAAPKQTAAKKSATKKSAADKVVAKKTRGSRRRT